MLLFVFLMIRRPPRSTRTDTRFPYTTLFRSRCCFVEVDVARALTEEHHADVRRPCVNGGIYGFGRRKAAYLDGDSGHGRGVDRPANICTTLMRTVKEWPRSPGRRGDRKSTRLKSSH